MLKYIGKGICGKTALGKAYILKKRTAAPRSSGFAGIAAELEKLEKAKERAIRELEEIHGKALDGAGAEEAQIFELHIMMLEDADYNEKIKSIISSQSANAEYAVALAAESFAEMLAKTDSEYMQARAADIRDISERLIMCMSEGSPLRQPLTEPSIICAEDITPSETVMLDRKNILAIVTARGSASSHTAILARSMNIPAVIGVGNEFTEHVHNGDTVAVDGLTGEIFLSPDEATVRAFGDKLEEARRENELLNRLCGKDNITLDGKRINIYANAGSLEDVAQAIANDAGGIGLFRSEFLYLERNSPPDEQTQFDIYKNVLCGMAGKKVIIRTLDVGADKKIPYLELPDEENPALGLRGIRVCLERPEIFKTQLRALYRASAFGNLAVMFPMITDAAELEKALAVCADVRSALEAEGLSFDKNLELGIMIETPAAAIISEKLAPLVSFFSVGTNDLTQYTLACDRQNPKLEGFCNPHHEAIFKLIEFSAQNAHRHGAWIGICGELAADAELTERFLRMGIDELSVAPAHVLKLRKTVRALNLSAQP